MRVNEIKKTVEQVVRVEYVAEDGTIFYNEEECKKYEESALFAVSKQLKKLNTKYISAYTIIDEGSEDNPVEIFDIQTEKDLENLRRYLYIKLSKKYTNPKYVEDNFINFDKITIGHEVIIWWNYDEDAFWKYGDGSINAYLEYIRNNIMKAITPEETKEV